MKNRIPRLSALLLTCLFAAALPCVAASSDDPPAILLYPGAAVAGQDEIVERPLSPDGSRNRLISRVANPTIALHRPEKMDAKKTAIVICPGGGYSRIAIDKEGHAFARRLARDGITGVVLRYRLPGGVNPGDNLPAPQQDAHAAIRWVRDHAAELGGIERVGIIGSSAGGHLACSSTLLAGEKGAPERPDFAVLMYPVVKMNSADIHRGSRDHLLGQTPTPEQLAKFSCLNLVRAGLPPFFIIHAVDDRVVPVTNSTDFAAALGRAKIPFEMHILPRGGHGFGLGGAKSPETQDWPAQLVDWLAKLNTRVN
jgi:acetyl esterase/lipase